jgi:hypothetical protein
MRPLGSFIWYWHGTSGLLSLPLLHSPVPVTSRMSYHFGLFAITSALVDP